MGKIVPQSTTEKDWVKLTAHRTYAIRAKIEEYVNIRLGAGGGFYFDVAANSKGNRMINSVNYEDGSLKLVTQLSAGETFVMGRTDESNIKILHAIVSRKHAEIRLDENIIIMTDLGSTNGTFIHKDNIYFDVEEYLKNHPVGKEAQSSTLDYIHEEFGPDLDDFLSRYQKEKQA